MIILTGSSGGIGSELVSHLLELDSVIGIYNNTKPKNHSKDKKLSAEKLNLESKEGINNWVKKNQDRLTRLTVVHLAALKIDGLAAQYAEADWDRMMNVNIKGDFLLTQALLPLMIKENWGRIIHVSSLGAMQGAPSTIAYSTTKTGLLGMSRALSKEYARFNITSNVLVLGHFDSGLYNKLSQEWKKKLLEQIPSRELGKVSNIANAVDFIMKSDYVNGATINIDGAAS